MLRGDRIEHHPPQLELGRRQGGRFRGGTSLLTVPKLDFGCFGHGRSLHPIIGIIVGNMEWHVGEQLAGCQQSRHPEGAIYKVFSFCGSSSGPDPDDHLEDDCLVGAPAWMIKASYGFATPDAFPSVTYVWARVRRKTPRAKS